jgi:hypothetical protein
MKIKIVLSILTLAAAPLLAADSSPKDEITAAAKKVAQKEVYAWRTTNDFNGFVTSGEGKADKEGFVWMGITFGDSTTEVFLKSGKGAVKQPDQDWQSLAELENDPGPIRFLVRRLQTFKAPADQAQDLVSKTKELKKDGDAYSGELTEAGAKELLTFGRRGSDSPGPKNSKGSVKLWVKDGQLSKYELKLSGTVSFGGDEQDLEGVATVEIKDAGKAKLEVPEAAKKKLS